MRFRATLIRVAIAGLPVVACTDGKTDGKTDTKSGKVPVTDARPPSGTLDSLRKIFVHKEEEIPEVLAGAIAPYEPPEVAEKPEEPKPEAPPSPAPAAAEPAASNAVGAAAAVAPAQDAEPLGAIAGRAVAPTPAPAVVIAHQHAAGEPCQPLARAEVEQALADLRQ